MKPYAKLIRSPGCFVRDENERLVNPLHYIGKTGKVLEKEDDGYNTDRPTGYESVYFLIDFGLEKLWIPCSYYVGESLSGKEIWEKYLSFHDEPVSE